MNTQEVIKLEDDAIAKIENIARKLDIDASVWKDTGGAEDVYSPAPIVVMVRFPAGKGGEADELEDGEKPRRERVIEFFDAISAQLGRQELNIDEYDLADAAVKFVVMI